jgi:hypothetical protein
MGLLERKWLIDEFSILLKEMEYYRDHTELFKLHRQTLWRTGEAQGRTKIETTG